MPASAPSAPSVGVVIRTLNERALLGRCLDVLAAQDCGADLDVLVVDSGSTDGTTDIARRHGARLVEIAPEDFDYSRALNLGIAAVRGDVVVILSAHAIPVDETWLRRMLDPFADPLVAGVASRQLPWSGASYREVHRLSREFDARRRTFDAECAAPIFSNAASCVRRSVWEAEPFTLPAAEDFEWAQRVTAAGWKVIYEPAAQVYHSHDESPRAQARRLIDLNRKGVQSAAHRPPWATVREALTYLRRDARVILALPDPVPRKLAHLRELLAMVCYYVADFGKQGSTAEFRRDVAPAGQSRA